MKQLFTDIMKCIDRGENLVLATIIAGHGSTPRGAGARMVVKEDGATFGTIGGGAVEYQAGLLALEVLKEKKSRTKGFKLSKEQVAGLGMICGGNVTVYFQYVDVQDQRFQALCGQIFEACGRDENSWLVTDITDETAWDMGLYCESRGLTGLEGKKAGLLSLGEQLFVNRAVVVEAEGHTFYSEPLVRAGKVYIFGGGHVSRELVPVLSHLGFSCVVYDDRAEFAGPETFPEAERTIQADFENIAAQITVTEHDYMVIMTRGHQYDYLLQRQALHTPARYIGVMGSRNKIKIISEKLLAEGFTEQDLSRFHTPIGLSILAETPAEIAISIAGELICERALTEGRQEGRQK